MSGVRTMSEYELNRVIEADIAVMRRFGHTPVTLAAAIEDGTACYHHDVPIWETYRSHVWLLTGVAL